VSLVLYIAIALLYALPANRFPFGKPTIVATAGNDERIAEGKGH